MFLLGPLPRIAFCSCNRSGKRLPNVLVYQVYNCLTNALQVVILLNSIRHLLAFRSHRFARTKFDRLLEVLLRAIERTQPHSVTSLLYPLRVIMLVSKHWKGFGLKFLTAIRVRFH